jgi:hypothetical protein
MAGGDHRAGATHHRDKRRGKLGFRRIDGLFLLSRINI